MSDAWRWQGCEWSAFLWHDGEVVGDVELIDSPEGEFWEWRVQLDDESASGASATRDRAIRDLRGWLATRRVNVPEVRG